MDPASYFTLFLNLNGHLTPRNRGMVLQKAQVALCILWQMANQDIQQMETKPEETPGLPMQSEGYAPVFINYILIS